MKRYFLEKSNFFQLRKIFTREYTKHASGTHSKPTFFARFIPPKTHKPKERKQGFVESVQFQKNKGARLHPFPLFLSLSSFSSPASCKARITTYILPYIYLYSIYMCDVRYIGKHSVFYVHSFVFACLFVSVLCVDSYSLQERSFVSFSSFLNRPTPTPISRYRIGGYPIP